MDVDSPIDAKSVRQCIACTTADANGVEESISAWIICLDEIFAGVKSIGVLGEQIQFKGFSDNHEMVVVAVCEKNNIKAKVSLDSIDTTKLSKQQRLWLKAYGQWN